MTKRTWLYSLLTTYPGLVALLGGEQDPRVFAKKSMTSSVEAHPYIVFKLGNNTSEDLAEDHDISRQYIQIFVHDYSDTEVSDYTRIDEVLVELRNAFRFASSAEDGVIAVRYLETSQDLSDETLSTVMKYARYQMITKES